MGLAHAMASRGSNRFHNCQHLLFETRQRNLSISNILKPNSVIHALVYQSIPLVFVAGLSLEDGRSSMIALLYLFIGTKNAEPNHLIIHRHTLKMGTAG
jgi:hypothetical protein